MKNSLLNKIKQFFGFFNLTPFEIDLLNALKSNIPAEWVAILDSQIERFNQVDRVVFSSDDLPFGHTSFYWIKGGKPRIDFPLKFPTKKDDDILATLQVISLVDKNKIDVTFRLIYGFLFSIEYRSDLNIFTPNDGYKIQNIKIKLPSSA